MASGSVFERALVACHTRVSSLDLAGVLSSSIVVYKHSWLRGLALPGVVVSPQADEEISLTSAAVGMRYECIIAMAQVSNQNQTEGLGGILLWREAISRSFREKGIVAALSALGVSELFDVRVRHGSVLWEPGFVNQHDVSAVMIDCFCRLARLP